MNRTKLYGELLASAGAVLLWLFVILCAAFFIAALIV